jgi:hypothetical protein
MRRVAQLTASPCVYPELWPDRLTAINRILSPPSGERRREQWTQMPGLRRDQTHLCSPAVSACAASSAANPLRIAMRHTAFGGHAVSPNMAPVGRKASGVALDVVTANEAEIKLGFNPQRQPVQQCNEGIVGAWLRHWQVE